MNANPKNVAVSNKLKHIHVKTQLKSLIADFLKIRMIDGVREELEAKYDAPGFFSILSSLTVLVVDDHPANVEFICGLLDELSVVDYHTANDGQQAYELMEELRETNGKPIDIILLDIHMPVMGGVDLFKKLVDNPRYSNMFTIFVTGDDSLGSVRSLKEVAKGRPFDYVVRSTVLNTFDQKILRYCRELYIQKYVLKLSAEKQEHAQELSRVLLYIIQLFSSYRRRAAEDELFKFFICDTVHSPEKISLIENLLEIYRLPHLSGVIREGMKNIFLELISERPEISEDVKRILIDRYPAVALEEGNAGPLRVRITSLKRAIGNGTTDFSEEMKENVKRAYEYLMVHQAAGNSDNTYQYDL